MKIPIRLIGGTRHNKTYLIPASSLVLDICPPYPEQTCLFLKRIYTNKSTDAGRFSDKYVLISQYLAGQKVDLKDRQGNYIFSCICPSKSRFIYNLILTYDFSNARVTSIGKNGRFAHTLIQTSL